MTPEEVRVKAASTAASRTNWSHFRWGCLGAVVPPLLSLYKATESGNFVPHIWLYYPVLAAWILISGAFTIAWRPDSEWKAIWVGASVPALAASMIATPLAR